MGSGASSQKREAILQKNFFRQILQASHTPIALLGMNNLLKNMKLEKSGDREMILGEQGGENYIVETQVDVNNPLQYDGVATIYRKEGQLKLFEGIFKKSQRQGFGIEYGSDGSIFYQGTFKENDYDGWGMTMNYEGEFRKGKKWGWGVLDEPQNNIHYEGYFQNDKFEGIGFMNVQLEEMEDFIGRKGFYEDDRLHFVGEWREGKMEGRGKLVNADEIYTGQLVANLFQGEGKLVNRQGEQEGTFNRGISHIK